MLVTILVYHTYSIYDSQPFRRKIIALVIIYNAYHITPISKVKSILDDEHDKQIFLNAWKRDL